MRAAAAKAIEPTARAEIGREGIDDDQTSGPLSDRELDRGRVGELHRALRLAGSKHREMMDPGAVCAEGIQAGPNRIRQARLVLINYN